MCIYKRKVFEKAVYTYAVHRHNVNAEPMEISHARWAVAVHNFSPNTPEAEAGGTLSSRPAWSTE